MTSDQTHSHRFVSPFNTVRIAFHLEGAGVALACGILYGQSGGSWMLFAALLLVPDLMMLGYLAGPRVGAALYNLGHTYIGPLALAGIGAWTGTQTPLLIGLIWGAHTGMDRALGYGLKYPIGFKDTHLGRV